LHILRINLQIRRIYDIMKKNDGDKYEAHSNNFKMLNKERRKNWMRRVSIKLSIRLQNKLHGGKSNLRQQRRENFQY